MTKKSIETFRTVGRYELDTLHSDTPSCMNGEVRVRRYRVTVEEIDEPIEVICARIQELWDTSDNWHHQRPLMDAAEKIGYTLKGDHGNAARQEQRG